MAILNRDYFTNSLVLICTGAVLLAASALTGCSGSGGSSAEFSAAETTTGTSTSIFSVYKSSLDSLTGAEQSALWSQLRVTTFEQLYSSLAGSVTNATTIIDGHAFSNVADYLASYQRDFTSAGATFGNLGGYFDAIGATPAALTEASLKADIASVADAMNKAQQAKSGLGLVSDPDPLAGINHFLTSVKTTCGLIADASASLGKAAGAITLGLHVAESGAKKLGSTMETWAESQAKIQAINQQKQLAAVAAADALGASRPISIAPRRSDCVGGSATN